MEKLGEPGSARYGNFINYYSFNPPERRVKLISETFLSDWFAGCERDTLLMLDIGCNSGVRILLPFADTLGQMGNQMIMTNYE